MAFMPRGPGFQNALKGSQQKPQKAATKQRTKPSLMSVEGTIMMTIAGIFSILNGILSLIGIIPGLDTLIAPVVNGGALIFIGGWMWMRTGRIPWKKAGGSFVLNSIPIPWLGSLISLVPFWIWAVWTSLDKGGGSTEQEQPQEQQPPRRAAQGSAS